MALEVHRIDPGGESDWDTFVNAHPEGSLYHTSAWLRTLGAGLGHDVTCLGARDRDGELLGVLPYARVGNRLLGRGLVSLPVGTYGGVLAMHDDATGPLLTALDQARETAGGGYAQLRHRRPEPDTRLTTRIPKEAFRLELSSKEAQMWDAVGSKSRNLIRKAERSALTATIESEGIGAFYRVYSRNMRDLGVPVFSRRFFKALLQSFSGHTRFIFVHHSGRIIGTALTITHRDVLEVPFASSLRDAFASNPNMLLYWTAIKLGIDSGLKVLDFGRSTPGSGPARFKAQWGARAESVYYQYLMREGGRAPTLDSSNARLSVVTDLWRRLPVPMANLLGPLITSRIPA